MDASARKCGTCRTLAEQQEGKPAPNRRRKDERAKERGGAHANVPAHDEEGMDDPRERLGKAVLAGALLIAGLLIENALHGGVYRILGYAIYLLAYVLVGSKVIRSAVRGLMRGELFDETFLMTAATFGAILIRQLPEAVAVMLFYSVGELVQDAAVDRSRRAISSLLDVRPDVANLKTGDRIEPVSPEEVRVGGVVQVRPGERVPLDGEVIEGESFVDVSVLTGEPTPVRVGPGEKVLAGMVNQGGTFDFRVERRMDESTVSRILNLVESAAARKARTERLVTNLARRYTPAVMTAALAIAIVPPIVMPGAVLSTWVYRALVLLVISCPCALLISIPLGYFCGLGGASRHGILVKGANALDALTALHTVVFDKTGTLTKGVFRVTGVSARNGYSREDVLELAALAETNSAHPIARSIMDAHGHPVQPGLVRDYQEISGYGVRALVDGKEILAGNDKLMHREMIDHDSCDLEGTVIYVAVNGVFAGYITISDEVRPDAERAVASLRGLGIKRVVMLTGDDEAAARAVAERVGMDEYFAGLLPEEKLARLEDIESRTPGPQSRMKLAFVGDGINDAPVIARAHVGVAMGGLGRDAAIEAADVVIMNDEPSRLATAIRIARSTRTVILQNILFALGMKAAFVLLGAIGVATMWEAVFADVGVALVAIANSTRTLRRRYDSPALSSERS